MVTRTCPIRKNDKPVDVELDVNEHDPHISSTSTTGLSWFITIINNRFISDDSDDNLKNGGVRQLG
jgi:hypothetical protein